MTNRPPWGMKKSLATPRLKLRLPTEADAAELHAIFADPETNTAGGGPFTSEDQTRRWIANREQAHLLHGLSWHAVVDPAQGVVIGNCGMLIGRGSAEEPELGYMISRSYQGRRYATEAARAVVAECRAVGMSRLWSTIRPSNAASRIVIERVGFHVDRVSVDARGKLLYYTLLLGPP